MKQKKSTIKALQGLVWLTQLGFSLVVPPLMLIWLAIWLQSRFDLGSWVLIAGILLGLGGSVGTALTFYRATIHESKKEQKPRSVGFNSHD